MHLVTQILESLLDGRVVLVMLGQLVNHPAFLHQLAMAVSLLVEELFDGRLGASQ
ncbi:hypothetical protein D3C72_2118500 [compost metagenome]